MELDRGWAYRDVAITSGEASALLGLKWSEYLTFATSGRLAFSLALCESRPEIFKAHSFWDLLEYSVTEVLLSLGRVELSDAQAQAASVLDEIAYALEYLDGGIENNGWGSFEQIFDKAIAVSAFTRCRSLAAEILRIWSRLERGFIDILQSTGMTLNHSPRDNGPFLAAC